MKKILLLSALACATSFAFAQKPAAGDKTAEVMLNLQTGTAGIGYGLATTAPGVPELRLRYFLAEDMAVRLRVGLGMTSTDRKVMDPTGTTTAEAKTSTGFGIALIPGIEKHFGGTSKLSPFMGAQLGIMMSGGGEQSVSNSAADPSTLASGTVVDGASYKATGGGMFTFMLGLYGGADYYVTDGIYVGLEWGLGLFSTTSTSDMTVSTKASSSATANDTKTLGTSTTSLFNASTGGVRLGYKF
jgi:hypothetical protein